MSETTTAYTFLRDNYNTTDLLPLAITSCIVGEETVPQNDGIGFACWLDLNYFAGFMVSRCPHWRGSGFWPSRLERGYRVVQLQFEAEKTSIGGGDNLFTILDLSHFPDDADQVAISRADVIAELSSADVYDVVPPLNQTVNYFHARDSMQIPI